MNNRKKGTSIEETNFEYSIDRGKVPYTDVTPIREKSVWQHSRLKEIESEVQSYDR